MRLVTFEVATPVGPCQRLGALHEGKIVDLNLGYAASLGEGMGKGRVYERAAFELPPDMVAFLKTGQPGWAAAATALEYVSAGLRQGRALAGPGGERVVYEGDEVRLLAPIPHPPSIRDFLSFEYHGRQPKHQDWYETPHYYRGNPFTVAGMDAVIPWPSYTEYLDYELEHGIYIAKEGKNIPIEEAHEYIAGYTIFNDISARDVPSGFFLSPAKMKDFCNVMGPCLVTPDELDPQNLRMVARINGEVWTEGNTKTMYWTWAELIHYASMEETLYPGDFLGSGTVENGCGMDHGRWIQPRDLVELEIEGIGVLRNRVGPRPERMRSPRLRKYTLSKPPATPEKDAGLR